MSRDSDHENLDALSKRIEKAEKAAEQPAVKTEDHEVAAHRNAIKIIRVGSDFVALIMLSVLAGIYLDRQFDTAPWVMMLLLCGAFGVGFWMIVRFISQKPSGNTSAHDATDKE